MEDTPTPSESELLSRTIYLWIETGVVLLACVLPMIFNSEADVIGLRNRLHESSFVYHAWSILVPEIGRAGLVLFIIWRSNDPPGRFGLVPFKIGRDLFGGILLYALLRGTEYLLWWSLRILLNHRDYSALFHTRTEALFVPPSGQTEFLLLALMCLVSGFFQELVMRAYLIVRFEELFESTSIAVLLSTVLFVAYHGYQGTAGMISVALFGVIQAIVFCLFRRLAPISLAHSINNFIDIGRVLRI